MPTKQHNIIIEADQHEPLGAKRAKKGQICVRRGLSRTTFMRPPWISVAPSGLTFPSPIEITSVDIWRALAPAYLVASPYAEGVWDQGIFDPGDPFDPIYFIEYTGATRLLDISYTMTCQVIESSTSTALLQVALAQNGDRIASSIQRHNVLLDEYRTINNHIQVLANTGDVFHWEIRQDFGAFNLLTMYASIIGHPPNG